MTYTDVFGGSLIFPSQLSYLQIDTAVDIQLQWPTEQQITGENVVADFLDINATAGGVNVDMPDARNTSTGNKTTINAINNDFTLRDATGGTIQFATGGTQWVIVLIDNTTEAGTWRTFQLGAGTTQANAAALAGAGLQDDGLGKLEQIVSSDVEAATPFDVVTGDRAKCLIYTAGAGTCNLQNQNDNFFCAIRNSGSGTLNIVPVSGNIDGSASINLDPDGSTFVFTDGTDWFTIGLTVASVIAFDFVSIAVPGSGDFTLTGANLNRISYRFTGALTGNRRIIVPNTTQQYWVDNQTTGAFTLEVTTAAGSGQTIPQGQSVITYCDATDVINAVSSTSVAFPILISQGGTSATDAATALSNLGGVADTRLINTQALSGLAGGGDLTADRDLELDIDNLTVENSPDFTADTIAFYDDDAAAMRKTAIENIGAIEVQDEGAPLATRAQSLDFVGGFVTASGAGATKTITIGAPLVLADSEQIQFGTGNDVQFEFDGTDMKIDTGGEDVIIETSVFNGDQQLVVANSSRGIAIRKGDSDGTSTFISDVLSNGAFVKDYIEFDSGNGQVELKYGNNTVAETAPVLAGGAVYPFDGASTATGGLVINNNTTGSGQNRALTYSDVRNLGSVANLGISLQSTPQVDSRLDTSAGVALRQGWYAFEMYVGFFYGAGGVAQDVIFDFDGGTNIANVKYRGDYRTNDGTPNGEFAQTDAATDVTIPTASASGDEIVHVRIKGSFQVTVNGGVFNFRWSPDVSQVDPISRSAGSWLCVRPIDIGV